MTPSDSLGGERRPATDTPSEQTIFFSGSIKLYVPDYMPTNDVRQLVQDEIGHSGIIVEEIVEAES